MDGDKGLQVRVYPRLTQQKVILKEKGNKHCVALDCVSVTDGNNNKKKHTIKSALSVPVQGVFPTPH